RCPVTGGRSDAEALSGKRSPELRPRYALRVPGVDLTPVGDHSLAGGSLGRELADELGARFLLQEADLVALGVVRDLRERVAAHDSSQLRTRSHDDRHLQPELLLDHPLARP